MNQYKVIITHDATMSAEIIVEANDKEEAIENAIECAKENYSDCEFEVDDNYVEASGFYYGGEIEDIELVYEEEKTELFCPICGKQGVYKKRGAFIEIGDYDEAEKSCEEEWNGYEYECRDCGNAFAY